MRKKTICLDQLAVLSFYRFGKLDGIDMTILMRMCSDVIDVDISSDSDKYSLMDNGVIKLNEGYVKAFGRNVSSELFEGLTGIGIYKSMDNIDMFEFMLRKIRLCKNMKDDILRRCSLYQTRIMKMMYQRGYVMDFVVGKDRAIKLTKRGELYLFLIDYRDEVDKFKMSLIQHGYNYLLTDAFLITQDLSVNIQKILVLDNFRDFVDSYDMAYEENDKYMKGYSRVKN